MVESKMDIPYVSKANTLKRKAVDVKNDNKKMEETLRCCKKKGKKIIV